MAEPNYNFSGLQKKTPAATPSSFNFSGLKQKSSEQEQERGFFPADASLLPKAPPQGDLLGAIASPFKNFAAGTKKLFVNKGDEPLVPLSKMVSRPEKPLTGGYGTLAGIGRGVAGLAESFTTPKNLAIAVATGGVGAIPIIGKVGLPAIEAFFAYDAAHQVPELWREYQKAPLADKPELMTKIIGSIGIAGLAGVGAAKKTAGLGKELKSLTDVAPEVATARPAPTGELFTPPAKVVAGRNELERASKTAKQVQQEARTVRTNEELVAAKARAEESNFLKQPKLQLEALTEELAGKPVTALSVKEKANISRKAAAEYRKRLNQNADVIALEQGQDLRSIPVEERVSIYDQARERLGQELLEARKAAKTSELPKSDIGDLSQRLEGVTGPTPRSVALPELEQAGKIATEIQTNAKPATEPIAIQAEAAQKQVDSLAERRRIVSEKRQTLSEERLKLQEQKLEAQRQKAIEQLSKKYKVTGLKKRNVEPQAPKGAEGATKRQVSAPARPFEQYTEGQKTVETTPKSADQLSEWQRIATVAETNMARRRREWIDKEREKNPQFAPDIESRKELLRPDEQREVQEYEDLRYKSVALQGRDAGYRPYKLTPKEKIRLSELGEKYRYLYFEKQKPSDIEFKAINARPSEQYAQGQRAVEGLIAKYKEQAIPKSEWSGLAKDELTKQGYLPRIVAELTEPRRTSLEQAPGYETSRAGRAERAVEPPSALKPKVDELANAAKPNQIAQADYERGRQEILVELEKDPNLRVYFDSGEGFYKVEVLQKSKLTPEALQAVQELRKQAALEGGYSLETVGRGHEIAVTPEGYYEGKPLAGTTLAEKIGDLVNRKKTADATHEAFVKAKNKAEPDLVDRHLTEEGAAPLLGKTTSGEGVEIVTRRNRSAVEPDAPEWVKQIEQAKRTGEKQLGDPYVSIYRVTEKTAKKAEGEGFTFLRKNLSEADNARLDAVFANMTKAANELSANPTFNIKIGLEAYKNLAEFGYLTLKASGKALLTKAEWASRMLSELGESVRPFLDDIWKSIQGGWKPGAELEMPKAFAEREPRAVEAKATLTKEEPPPSAGDKVNEWARNVKLASTSSLIRSGFGGNLTMQLLKTPKRLIAAGANRALAAITGAKRDRFGQEAAVELYGTLRTLKQGVDEALHVIREDPVALKESLFLAQETGRSSGAIQGRKGYYIRMPQKLQGAIDAIFRVPSGQGLIDMLAVRQAFKEGLEGKAWVRRVDQLQTEIRAGNTELGKQLLAKAKSEAAEMTFQSELGHVAQKINAVRDVPGVRFLVPFFNTWVNLWKQGIRHTPLNVLRPTFVRAAMKAFEKNPELKSIGSLSDEIAAMTSGTAFSLATYGILTKILDGDIIGYGPADQRERQRLLASGWKPYSLKIGDSYISFKGFEPVSTWLTMMADANEGREKEGVVGLFNGVSENVVRNFIENPFLTGITETMDALRGESKPEEFLAGMALGATIPTFLQQTARVIDPKYRQTPKDADVLEKFAAEYTKRVPFLSKTLPSELDVFGKERTVDSPALRYLAVNISKQDRGAIQDELRRLDVGIGFPRDTYKGLELTEPQMRELLVLAGGRMEKALAKMVISPGYKQLRDEEKKSAINYVVNKVREDSKEFLFKHLATKKIQPKNRGSAVARPFAR